MFVAVCQCCLDAACLVVAVVWVVMAEVVPNQLRDKAFSIFLNVSWLCVLITSMGTLEGSRCYAVHGVEISSF
jgi:hypothetical protein